ncbi:MAG TPA: glycosyltransferase [Pseudonocardiaceae bacterium]|nr:glycosyltransferase [Pseudonocardiaceae bacterium]
MITAGILLATVAACLYGVAAALQHQAVHTVSRDTGRLRLAHLTGLLRQRRWLVGWVAEIVAAAVHVVSLALAPLSVVQPIGVVAIALAALLSARLSGVPAGRSTMVAVVVTALGVGMFLLSAAPHASAAPVPPMAAGRVLPLTGLAVGALVLAAVLVRGRARCPLFATAAGVAFGTVSVLTRVVAERIRVAGIGGMPPVPTAVTVIGGLIAIGVGAVCVQQAYASGRPDTVLGCQTVVDPLIGVLFGVFLFHEATGATPVSVLGQVAGGLLATFGVVILARRAEPAKPVHPPTRKQAMDRPLRIIIGADTYPPDVNGAARFGHQLATGLAGLGHDVHVLCPSDTGPADVSTDTGVTVHRLASHRTPCHPTFRVTLPWSATRMAGDLVDGLAPDVVHVQAHFSVGRALVRSAADRGVPVIATNHFMPENLHGHLRVPGWLRSGASRLAWRDLGRVLAPARVVTAPTPTAVHMLCEQGFAGRALAVSCGVDLDRFASTGPGDGRTVLFVGRLDEEKRVHELIRAVALVPGIRAEVVGDGSCRAELVALARTLGVADRVRFLGFVSETELVAAYHRAAVFCMPGVAELQSLATMEAMAAGRPVVVADAVALPHLVEPGRNGWLYPPGDVPALAGRLASVFDEPGALAAMGAASRELVERHDVRHSLATFEGLYRSVIGTDGNSAEIVSPRVSFRTVGVRP